jgi:hypothetical protein
MTLLAAAGSAHAQGAGSAPVTAPAPGTGTSTSDLLQGSAAVLQGLDKTTARVSKFDAPIDKPVRFGTLVITVRACFKHPPEETPETTAFLEIDETRPNGATDQTNRVFSGWMFASSPAISALEDPIYDVNVLDCRIPATSAPPGGASGK